MKEERNTSFLRFMSTGGQWFKDSYGKQKSNSNPLLLVSVAGVEGSAGSRSAYMEKAGNKAQSPRLYLCIPGREPGHSHRRIKAATNRSAAPGWTDLVLFCRNLASSSYGNRIRRMQKWTLFFYLCAPSPALPWREQMRLFHPETGGLFL